MLLQVSVSRVLHSAFSCDVVLMPELWLLSLRLLHISANPHMAAASVGSLPRSRFSHSSWHALGMEVSQPSLWLLSGIASDPFSSL